MIIQHMHFYRSYDNMGLFCLCETVSVWHQYEVCNVTTFSVCVVQLHDFV